MPIDDSGSPISFEWLDPAKLSYSERYRLLSDMVVPRPIALVTTLNDDGSVNAAPFSEFMIIAVSPGLLGFSAAPGESGPKDTVANIQRTGEFVINTVPQHLAQAVQACGEALPRNDSEIIRAGLKTLPSQWVSAPRVAQSRVQFECTLHRIMEFGDRPNALVVGEIRRIHATRGLVRDGRIDPLEYQPLGRIGGRRYCTLGTLIDV